MKTIKEQIEFIINENVYDNYKGETLGIENASDKIESIVEDVALRFGEYLTINYYPHFELKKVKYWKEYKYSKQKYTTKELYALFKKENNL